MISNDIGKFETLFATCAVAWLVCSGGSSLLAQTGDKRWEEQGALPEHFEPPPSPARTPEEEKRTFQLDPAFEIQLVAAEPNVQDPVAMTFDEDGRMWVVEMRGFMHDVEGAGESSPLGRVSVLEDKDADGYFESSAVFVDGLTLPRAIARHRNGALIADNAQLYYAEDLNGDLKADSITIVDRDYIRSGNPEHQPNGLLRNIDNWIYSAKSSDRYRWRGGKWIKEETEFRGQWGIAQDDYGRMFYNYNWDQLRGDVTPPNYLTRNPNYPSSRGLNLAVSTNQTIFPIRMNTGVNRAYRPGILDERGFLKQFTSASAPLTYRGKLYPDAFHGNVFVCEPAANLIKRNILIEEGLNLYSRFAYPDREFLASTDERFRPVNLSLGLDGALYVVDMYRGILQHKEYMTTHLRGEILSRNLETPIHLGRIWRIVPKGFKPAEAPVLSGLGDSELARRLTRENGAVRDQVQRLLIERHAERTIPYLAELAEDSDQSQAARVQAIWTLEGLNANKNSKAREALISLIRDSNAKVQCAAIRAVESLAREDVSLQYELTRILPQIAFSSPEETLFQISLTLGNLKNFQARQLLYTIFTRYPENLFIRDAVMSGIQGEELLFLQTILQEQCRDFPDSSLFGAVRALTQAIAREGDPARIQQTLEWTKAGFFESGWPWPKRAIMAGIGEVPMRPNQEPMRLEAVPEIVEDAERSEDPMIRQWLENFQRLFAWPGHENEVESSRARTVIHRPIPERMWTYGKELYLSVCAACHGPDGQGLPLLGPPLVGSDWVVGDPDRLTRIVLRGLEGPIHVNGKQYAPPDILPNMPSVSALDSPALAAVLSYIRRDWGNYASAVSSSEVESVRQETVDREDPYTEQELNAMDSP